MKKLSFFILVLFLTGCSAKSSGGNALARFDGAVILEKEYTRRFETLPKEVRSVASRRKKEFLDDLVAEHFLLKEAERRGIQKDPEVKELLEAARRKIIIAKLIEKEVDEKITLAPDEAEKYYQDHQDEFMTALTLRASHILVKTQEEAALIKTQIEGGADFEDAARRHSLDSTAIRGGDLGFFQKGRFVPEFEDAVFVMKKGELKGPVKSQFGYHLIKLTDRLEPTLRQLRDVKNFVEQRLVGEKRSRAFKDLVEKLKAGAKIDVDEKRLDALDLKP